VTLDNRGERDLGRVVDFLKDKLDRQIILAGFADNSGDYEVNNKLAKIRAETVAEQLRARGIVVNHIASGGEELPVASNLSLAGREKNRRVEVWLR
jgi:phosphate transport system substrate-binding protein